MSIRSFLRGLANLELQDSARLASSNVQCQGGLQRIRRLKTRDNRAATIDQDFVLHRSMSFKCGIFLLVLVCSIGYCKYLSVHIPKHTNTHTQIKIVLNLSLFLKCGVHNKSLSNSLTLMHSINARLPPLLIAFLA
nr:uncharacterized protein LOC131776090 [Pocillopora verrucosa]